MHRRHRYWQASRQRSQTIWLSLEASEVTYRLAATIKRRRRSRSSARYSRIRASVRALIYNITTPVNPIARGGRVQETKVAFKSRPISAGWQRMISRTKSTCMRYSSTTTWPTSATKWRTWCKSTATSSRSWPKSTTKWSKKSWNKSTKRRRKMRTIS